MIFHTTIALSWHATKTRPANSKLNGTIETKGRSSMSRISQPCHLSSRCIRARKRSAGRRSCSMMTELTWSASKRMPPSSLYPWPHHLSPSTPSAITALLCRRIGSLGHSWNSATPTRNSKRRVLPRQRMEKSRRLNSIPMAFF